MSSNPLFEDFLLPGLPAERIRACYSSAPGNEIESGKFFSAESSAALSANAFGLFLEAPELLPPLPDVENVSWPPVSITLEAQARFPWSGGRHPCLDVLITAKDALIGVESKRYEPFRSAHTPEFSEAYRRDVWGGSMRRYEAMRDSLMDGSTSFQHLDAAQLVKHALGLRTTVHKQGQKDELRPVLIYVYAEPPAWPDNRPVSTNAIRRHREEIDIFAKAVEQDEVIFAASSYRELLDVWQSSKDERIRDHASAVIARFNP